MTRHRHGPLFIWGRRLLVATLTCLALFGCASRSQAPTAASSPQAAISAGATDLHSVLAAVHASPDGAYAVEQVSQCPGMTDIASFFVPTTSANKSTLDSQRFAILDYMSSKSNREKVYSCVSTKFGMNTTQEHAFGKCVEPKIGAAVLAGGFSKDQIVANLKPVLLNGFPSCYTTATGRQLTPPPTAPATPTSSPSSSSGA